MVFFYKTNGKAEAARIERAQAPKNETRRKIVFGGL